MKKPSDLKIPFVWEDRRPVLLDRFFYVPSLYNHEEGSVPMVWSDPKVFGNEKPVILEYCSGNGQWICEKAKQYPDRNWVALDIRFDRCRKTWVKLHRENLSNLYVICGDARILTRYYLPKGCCVEIFMNFPDPWPKLRHAKHRLVQTPFLQDVQAMLTPQGKATFVTDDANYALQILAATRECGSWTPLVASPYYTLNPIEYGESFFSDLWKKRGKDIYLIPFQKVL